MYVKNDSTTTPFMIVASTMLASPFISLAYFITKFFVIGSIPKTIGPSRPISMLRAVFCSIGVLFFCLALVPWCLAFFSLKPSFPILFVVSLQLYNVTPIIIRLVSWLKAHFFYRWVVSLPETFIPRFTADACVFCIRMVPPYIFGGKKDSSTFSYNFFVFISIFYYGFILVNREWGELFFTSTLTNKLYFFTLSFRRLLLNYSFPCNNYLLHLHLSFHDHDHRHNHHQFYS